MERQRRRRLAGPAGAAFLLALASGLAACGKGAETPAAAPPTVTVAHPVSQAVTSFLEFTGNTASTDSVMLVARVEGFLDAIHFTDGADVKQGDVLFTIQPEQYQAQLQQAEAQVAAQKAALGHAKTELARYSGLVKEDSAPQTEVDRWQYNRDASAAALLGAESQVQLAKLNLSYTRVTAPFDGRMGRHLVDPGNLVGGPGQPSNLAEIDKTDPLYVYFTIDERDLLRIRAAHPKDVGTLPQQKIPVAFGLLEEDGYPHEGHLDFASLSVAPTTGTLEVRGVFPNPNPGVLPGLFARVRIPTGPAQGAMVIPGAALGFDQQGEYVLTVDEEGVVAKARVETGAQVGENFVVEKGLTASDWVVVDGIARAIPGRKVTADRTTVSASGASPPTSGTTGDAPPAAPPAPAPSAKP